MEPTQARTVEQVLRELEIFTPEQQSLAWCPEPPFMSEGAHDCRRGGSCGLDFNRETPRARWIQARYRWQHRLPPLPLRTP
jgi:hypothetical protein